MITRDLVSILTLKVGDEKNIEYSRIMRISSSRYTALTLDLSIVCIMVSTLDRNSEFRIFGSDTNAYITILPILPSSIPLLLVLIVYIF